MIVATMPGANRLLKAVLTCAFGLLCSIRSAQGAANNSTVHVSAWYWLNSVPASQWKIDFAAIHSLGFTDVTLVWGLDAAAFAVRSTESQQAIRAARQAGLGSYLLIWDPRFVSLLHRPQFQQVDPAGERLFAFDAFDPAWRKGQWKTYLQTVARAYGSEPGLAGYVFQDSFAIGRVSAVDGPSPKTESNYISYGPIEKKMFGKQPPASDDDPSWDSWVKARQGWWAAWALETRIAVRAADGNPAHEMLLLNDDTILNGDTRSHSGVNIRSVALNFDGLRASWSPDWSDRSVDSSLGATATNYLARMRAALPAQAKLSFTVQTSSGEATGATGNGKTPTFDQIKRVIDAAVAAGVQHVDLIGYRMGLEQTSSIGWHNLQPGASPTYPITGQNKGEWLCDRPELRSPLRAYLHRLTAAKSAPAAQSRQ